MADGGGGAGTGGGGTGAARTGGVDGNSANDGGTIPPDLRVRLDAANSAWAAAKTGCATYSYDRRWQSAFPTEPLQSTEVEVMADRPTRRRYSTGATVWADGGTELRWTTVWDETGTEVGSHTERGGPQYFLLPRWSSCWRNARPFSRAIRRCIWSKPCSIPSTAFPPSVLSASWVAPTTVRSGSKSTGSPARLCPPAERRRRHRAALPARRCAAGPARGPEGPGNRGPAPLTEGEVIGEAALVLLIRRQRRGARRHPHRFWWRLPA